ITTYPELESYIPERAEGYFQAIYPNYEEERSEVGISGLMSDKKFNLFPDDLQRLNCRKEYEHNETHASLKDKRYKRD
ncbi:lysine 2,3-aminomutase, partial [Bacillus paranthracis]|nr:lysine 2,3-aminomutase [Bacillus paranthracis]